MLTLAKNLASFNPEGTTISGGPASVCVSAFFFLFASHTKGKSRRRQEVEVVSGKTVQELS